MTPPHPPPPLTIPPPHSLPSFSASSHDRQTSGDDFSPGAASGLPRSISTDSLNPGGPSPSSSSPLSSHHPPPEGVEAWHSSTTPLVSASPVHGHLHPHHSYHYHHPLHPPTLESIAEQKRADPRKPPFTTPSSAASPDPSASLTGTAGTMPAMTTLLRGSSGRKEGQREGEEKESAPAPPSSIAPSTPFTQRSQMSSVAYSSPSYHPQPVGMHPSPSHDRSGGPLPPHSLDRSHLTNHSPHTHSHPSSLSPSPPSQSSLTHTHSSVVPHSHSSVSSSSSSSSDSSLDSNKVRAAVEESPDAKWARYPIKLGSGTFKDVWLAIDTETGKEVAWNVVDFRRVAAKDQQRIRQETSLLTQLRHPHIIEIYDVWENAAQHNLCFITQKSSYTLKQHIANLHPAKVKVIKKYCRQILSALAYLHSLTPPIIHRDIKADNIFIDGTTGDIRIGDFGLSISSSNPTSIVGTPGFLSPEMFGESYNELVDIWSFGMCVASLHTSHSLQSLRFAAA